MVMHRLFLIPMLVCASSAVFSAPAWADTGVVTKLEPDRHTNLHRDHCRPSRHLGDAAHYS
jgi:hypothetical protein